MELPRNRDPLAQRVASAIARAISPARIILFGSRARGDGRLDSDLDLLIIYDGPIPKRQIKLMVRRLFPMPDFSMDLFVLTSEEFEAQKNVVSTVGRAAATQGALCYG